MGRLTIQEVIEHCERHVKGIERNLEMYRNWLELEPMPISVKRYWEHKQTAEWLKELQHYKDLEEQGRLIELPCKVGDTVWNANEYLEGFKIRPMEIVLMEIGGKGKKYVFSVYTDDDDNDELVQSYGFDDFGYVLFLTKEEAEAKLKELKGE